MPLRHPQRPLSLRLPLSGHIYSDRLSDRLRGNWYLTLQKEKAIESEENSRIVSLKTLLSLEQGERSGESNRNGSVCGGETLQVSLAPTVFCKSNHCMQSRAGRVRALADPRAVTCSQWQPVSFSGHIPKTCSKILTKISKVQPEGLHDSKASIYNDGHLSIFSNYILEFFFKSNMYYSGPWANRQLKLDPKEISALCIAEDSTNDTNGL